MIEPQTQIIDLSDLTKDEILEKVQQILQESKITTFTLLLKRSELISQSQKQFRRKQNSKIKLKSHYSTCDQPALHEIKNIHENKVRLSTNGFPGKMHQTLIRLPNKKASTKYSLRSKQPLKLNQSVANQTTPIEQIPKSLQFYYEGEYELAIQQFFQEEKQLKLKMEKYTKQQLKKEKVLEDYAKLMINIGNCYFYEKEYEKAITYFKAQIESQNIDEKIVGQKYNNLGSCYAHKKQNQQSLKCFNQALKIYAKYPDLDCSNLLKNIGVIYFRSGMYSSAEDYFEQSINERKIKSPENEEALLNSYYKLALCQRYTQKFEEAINNLLFGLNISQKGYELHDSILKQLAQIYQLQDRYSQALAYYEKLSDIYERDQKCQGQIYENVAKIHQKLGNFCEHEKFMKLAYTEYRRFNIERKMSQLMSGKYDS